MDFPPAYRIAYDMDDTTVKILDLAKKTSVIMPITSKRKMNDEYYKADQTVKITKTQAGWVSLLFDFKQPINFNAYAMFMKYSGLAGASIEFNPYAHKTSNGFNGTWDGDIPIINSDITKINELYRTEITQVPYNNVKAIRFNFLLSSSAAYVEIGALHLYAFRSDIATKELALCDSSGNEVAPDYFDFGSVSASTNETKEFYIKNISDRKITKIIVQVDIPTEVSKATPPYATVASQHKLSLDNTNWNRSVQLGANGVFAILSPGQIYGPIYFKRNTAANPEKVNYCGKIFANGKLI